MSAAFPPERRGSALGVFFGVTGLAVGSGPVVGGAIAEGLAWEWIFWLNVPIGLAMIPLVLRRIEESFGGDTGIDAPGLALVTGGALGIVWGLVRGNAAGWDSAEVVGSLAAGVLLAAAFVAWELRAREPMLPMRFFRSRAFSAGNAAIFCLFASLFTAVFFLAQFLQTALGYGPLDAGLRLVPWTATLMVCAPIAGALADRLGERPFMVGGLLLQAVGMGWIALIADPAMSYSEMIAPLIIAGAGVSMAIPSAQNAVVGSVPVEAIGKAAGTNSTMRELGGVFGIAISVAVFAGAGSYASAQAFTDGFAPAIGVSAALALLGAFAGAWLPGRSVTSLGGIEMKRVMVRYRVKPDQVEANETLVRAVFDELHRERPGGFGYATFKLDDGVSFVHIVDESDEDDRGSLTDVKAFARFREAIRDRCDEPPVATELHEVGSFRLFDR